MAQMPPQPLPSPPSKPMAHQACLNLALQGFGKWFATVAAQHKLFPSNFRLSQSSVISRKIPEAESRQGQCGGAQTPCPLTGQKMISKTSIEAVDGGSSEKAESSLLALTAQGGTTL